MDSELASAAIIAGYWQATAVVIGVVVLASGAFSLVSLWAGRHIDAKFDKHAAATDAKLEKHAAATDAKLDKHAAATDAKFDAMDAKLDRHAAATAAAFEKFAAATDAKFDAMDAKFDAKFDAQGAAMEARLNRIEEAVARGTKEHEDWRVEMKAINERVTDLYIDREVERRMQASRGGAPAAGSDGADA